MEELPYDKLPLGFRFRPTDQQLISHYLKQKINGTIQPSESWVIPEIDLCRNEPWDLPSKWSVKSSDLEWFFFAAVDRKYPSGNRSNRATEKGYWKATGKDRLIKSNQLLVGMKKTLVFHIGRAPKGIGSCWTMHEYRVVNQDGTDVVGDEGAFVLCRLFKKEKVASTKPENGADILKEESTTPISNASPNSDLLDKPHNTTLESAYVQTIENNMANDEVVAYSLPAAMKPEQSHSNSDISTDFGNHQELRKNQEDDSLFDGLKDFLGPDYELYLSDEAPQNYPFLPYTVEGSSMDSNDQFAVFGLSLSVADDISSSSRQRVLRSDQMHEAVDSNNENLTASGSYETEINIRRRWPVDLSDSVGLIDQQGTAERRIKLERVNRRIVKERVDIEPPVAAPTVRSRKTSKTVANGRRTQNLSFLEKSNVGFSVPMCKIGVIVVIVTVLCAGAIWILAS